MKIGNNSLNINRMLFFIFLFKYSSHLTFFDLLYIWLKICCNLHSSIFELRFFSEICFVIFLAKLPGNYEFRYSLSVVLSAFGLVP